MQITIRYTRDGTTHEVTTSLAVIIAWEKRFKSKAPQLVQAVGMEDLAFMAYEASKRAQIVVPGEFDRFCDTLEQLEVVDTEQQNPTIPAP